MPPKPELPSEVFQARTGQVPDPNRDIIAKEDHLINHPSAQQRTELAEYLSTVNLNAASTGSDVGRVLNYPTRPGYADGIPGKNFTLFTNHFKMTFDKSLEIHRYNISVTHLGRQNDSPDILREERQPHGDNLKDPVGKKLRRVVQLFIQEGPLASQRSSLASNFTTLVLSPKQLSAQLLSGHVRYRDDDARTPGTVHDVYDVHLTLAPGPTLSMSALQDYLDTATSRYSSSSYEGFKEALNIVLGHYPKSQTDDRIMSIGQQHYNTYNHHNQHHSLPIGQGLRAYRGFMISARLSAGCMLAQVQIKHVAVYKPINLYDMLHEYGFSDRPALSNFIRGLRVKITYLGGTRIRTVTGLAMKSDNDPKNGQAPKVEADGAYTNQVEVWTDDSKNETPKQGSSKQAASKQAASKQKQVSQQNSGPKQDASSSSQGSSGKRINLYTYFEGKYQNTRLKARIPDPDDLKQHGSRAVKYGPDNSPKYMPAELCEVLPFQPCRKQLTASQTDGMLKKAAQRPAVNARAIEQQSGPFVFQWDQPQTATKQFGIVIEQDLSTVPAKLLNSPRVRYGGKSALARSSEISPLPLLTRPPGYPSQGTTDGQWNMRDMLVNRSGRLKAPRTKWKVFYLGQPEDRYTVNLYLYAMRDEFQRLGVDIGKQQIQSPRTKDKKHLIPENGMFDLRGTDENSLLATMRQARGENFGLLVFILPSKDAKLYRRIKHVGDGEVGMHTICMQIKPFFESDFKAKQYWANVGLKLNLKLGGGNQKLGDLDYGIMQQGHTMLMGLDVTHPATGSSLNTPSIAAIVSTTDKYCYQFPAVLKVNTARKEMVDREQLGQMVKKCLERWKPGPSDPQGLPHNIIIYRDGVSEGQYTQTVELEYTSIREACAAYYTKKQRKGEPTAPKISIIVCGKRHNTRFYPSDNNLDFTSGKTGNPRAGTLVDRIVTTPTDWDFYLQSHSALQGTAKPCHYIVIHDEIFKSDPSMRDNAANALISLTHNLCYMYGRATKAVSVCPPAYYADKAADRAHQRLAKYMEWERTEYKNKTDRRTPDEKKNAILDAIKIHQDLADTMFYV